MTEPEGLRERQARAVRNDLRAAFVRLVAARGLDAVSLAEVAAEAGVSERTLYRHYASRDDLLQAVRDEDVAAMDARIADGAGPWDLHDPEAMVRVYEVFEEHADLMAVGRMLRLAGLDHEASAGRTDRLRRAFTDLVHPDALDQMVGLGRVLGGSVAWARLREADVGLDNRRAGQAVQWAMQVLAREATKADGPLVPAGDEGDEGDDDGRPAGAGRGGRRGAGDG